MSALRAAMSETRPRRADAESHPVRKAGRRPRPAAAFRRSMTGYLFLLPALFGFGLFVYYPIVRGIETSFQRVNFVNAPQWVGLDNFSTVIHDPVFARAWLNSFLYAALGLLFAYLLPLILSLAIHEVRFARGFFQVAVYIPVMMPPVVTALLWRVIFDPGSRGLLNAILHAFGSMPQLWLSSPRLALPSIVAIVSWAGYGFAALLYLAALQGIPASLYEAAELDGAGIASRIRYITYPHVRNIVAAMLMLGIINQMQIFTEPFALTGGGPNNATMSVVLLIYRYAFSLGDFGAAAALSVILLMVLAVISGCYMWISNRITRV